MIATLAGLFFFGIGFLGLREYKRFFKTAIIVPGVITGYKSYQKSNRESGGKTTLYHTVASFQFDGQARTVTSRSSSSAKPVVGKPVQVGVNPTNIQEAHIYSKSSVICLWLFMGVGFLMLLVGIVTIRGYWKD